MEKIPIKVGVIGNRDAITESVLPSIRKIFTDIQHSFPSSPILLYSQLAVGADSDVAKIFLDLKRQNPQMEHQLQVPLPFPIEEYRKQFFGKDKEEFENLLAKADEVFEVFGDEAVSDLRYRKGGKFVVDQSLILIVIWNGKDINNIGGTSDLVYYKRNGSFKNEIRYDSLFESKKGPFIEILCNRVSDEVKVKFKPIEDKLSQLLNESNLDRLLVKLEQINRDAISEADTDLEMDLYPSTKLSATSKSFLSMYKFLDDLAIQHQKRYHFLLKGLFLLAFFILCVYQTYSQFGKHQATFVATIALIGIFVAVYNFSDKWSSHTKYLENRLMAEGMRIQFFWNLVGINEPVSRHVLSAHDKEKSWIKLILDSIYKHYYNDNDKISLDSYSKVKAYWIEDQKSYFESKVQAHLVNKKHFDKFSNLVLIFAFIILLSITVLSILMPQHFVINLLILLDTILFGFFILSKGYFEKRGFTQINNQNEMMLSLYSTASVELNKIDKSKFTDIQKQESIKQLMFEVGKESLKENAYWYIIFKDKEPQIEGFGV